MRPSIFLWILLLVLVGLPLALLIAISLNTGDPGGILPSGFGFANYARLRGHLDWLANTLIFAFGVTTFSTAIGVALAWIVARTTLPGRTLLTLLIILPYPMGPMVAALAWGELGAAHSGLINELLRLLTGSTASFINIYSIAGVIFVQSMFQAPVTFLLVNAALRSMDPSLEEAAAVLGAGKAWTAGRITLPLMTPAIVGAALFAFVSTLGAFAIPTVLGTESHFHVVTDAVYVLFSGYPSDYPLTAVLGVVLVAITALAVLLVNRVLRGRSFVVVGGKTHQPKLIRPGAWTPLLCFIAYGYVAVALVLPLIALAVASFQRTNFVDLRALTWTLANYHYVLFEYPLTREAIVNSIVLGLGTGILGVVLAAAIAITVEKARRAHRRAGALEQLAMVPQAVPRLIFALALLWLILQSPIHVYGTIAGILIAYVIVFLPLAYRSLAGVVGQIDASLEEAARTLGASGLRATWSITLPLLRPGLAAAGVLLFMISISEVGASILLSGPESQVLGPAMFNFYDSGGLALVSALALVQTVIVIAALAVLQRISGRWLTL